MLVHGFLHLIGYDHDNEKNFLKMEKIQNKILKLA
jgi:rRNA maturation RNase YbeY